MRTTRRRAVRLLGIVSVALWVAVVLSMISFSEGADEIDEGVNVDALYLALLALTLTVATVVLTIRSRPADPPAAQESARQGQLPGATRDR